MEAKCGEATMGRGYTLCMIVAVLCQATSDRLALVEIAYQLVGHFGQEFMLERMDARGERVGGVGWEYRAGGLEDDFAAVVLFVHIVDGYAGKFFVGSDNGPMHRVAVESFAAKFR